MNVTRKREPVHQRGQSSTVTSADWGDTSAYKITRQITDCPKGHRRLSSSPGQLGAAVGLMPADSEHALVVSKTK
jgi:hypothetical protein